MKVKFKTNIDPWSKAICKEIEIGKAYGVEEVVIGDSSTRVYLENGHNYNSVMFNNAFQKKCYKAIDIFNSDEDSGPGDRLGVFVRDYY